MTSLLGQARAVSIVTPDGPVTVVGMEVAGTDGRFVVHQVYLAPGRFSARWEATHAPTGRRIFGMREPEHAAQLCRHMHQMLVRAGAPIDETLYDWLAGTGEALSWSIEDDLVRLADELEPEPDPATIPCPDEVTP